jgi:hypothetical protein
MKTMISNKIWKLWDRCEGIVKALSPESHLIETKERE